LNGKKADETMWTMKSSKFFFCQNLFKQADRIKIPGTEFTPKRYGNYQISGFLEAVDCTFLART
jgi:hypothetical protein